MVAVTPWAWLYKVNANTADRRQSPDAKSKGTQRIWQQRTPCIPKQPAPVTQGQTPETPTRNKLIKLITDWASSSSVQIEFADVQSTVEEHVGIFVAYGKDLTLALYGLESPVRNRVATTFWPQQ
jgi:hypothetical protein